MHWPLLTGLHLQWMASTFTHLTQDQCFADMDACFSFFTLFFSCICLTICLFTCMHHMHNQIFALFSLSPSLLPRQNSIWVARCKQAFFSVTSPTVFVSNFDFTSHFQRILSISCHSMYSKGYKKTSTSRVSEVQPPQLFVEFVLGGSTKTSIHVLDTTESSLRIELYRELYLLPLLSHSLNQINCTHNLQVCSVYPKSFFRKGKKVQA